MGWRLKPPRRFDRRLFAGQIESNGATWHFIRPGGEPACLRHDESPDRTDVVAVGVFGAIAGDDDHDVVVEEADEIGEENAVAAVVLDDSLAARRSRAGSSRSCTTPSSRDFLRARVARTYGSLASADTILSPSSAWCQRYMSHTVESTPPLPRRFQYGPSSAQRLVERRAPIGFGRGSHGATVGRPVRQPIAGVLHARGQPELLAQIRFARVWPDACSTMAASMLKPELA